MSGAAERRNAVLHWCQTHPIGTVLLTCALVSLGVIAFFRLPIAPLPEADFPTLQISAQLPGASPETIASAVAAPLEVQFSAVAGITEMTSTSALGSVSIVLQFSLDTDIDSAAQEIQAAINTAAARLPADMPSLPTWRKVNPADSPVFILSVTSSELTQEEVSDYAESVLARQLSQVQGVGEISISGLRRPAIRVQASPEVLASLGLTLADVRNTVQQSSRNQATGALVGSRVSTIETNRQLFDTAEYENLILAYRDGAPVYLGDVASISLGSQDDYVGAVYDGVPGVALVIRRQPGANIVETTDRITEMLPRLRETVPAAISVEVFNDRTRTIRASLLEVQTTLMIAIALVLGVMALFLRQLSATLIVTSVLGVSLVGTCAGMYLLGFSLNNLTLVAIVVAVGFIVDDAIVVVENIHRHLESGMSRKQAALQGASEIAPTVISITLSLVAVLIPLLLMGGVVGRLFREFALTTTIATTTSVVVALTLAPTLAALFMRAPQHGEGKGDRFDQRLRDGYARLLRWSIAHQRTMLGIFLLAVTLSVAGFIAIPKGFFPLQDTGMVFGISQANEDIAFDEMHAKQQALADIIAGDPAVMRVGFGVGATGNNQILSSGRFWIVLTDRGDRDVSAEGFIDRIRPQLQDVPGIQLFLRSSQDINLGVGGSRTQYQYVLKSTDREELYLWSERLTQAMQAENVYRDVSSDLQLGASVTRLEVDREAAARFGISAAEINNTLYDAFGQRQINEYQTSTNQYRVVLEIDAAQRGELASLDYFSLRSPLTGEMVPLSEMVYLAALENGPLSVQHHGMLPAVNVSFNLAPGYSLGEGVERLRAIEQAIGMPGAVQGQFQGSAQAFQDSLASQPLLILAALLAAYIILGVLYESFIHPLTILSTLPSAGIGAMLLLWLMGHDFSIMALIGLILLIGIVKKNGILMVDFALTAQREQGASAEQAIYEACLTRFRPIMMTTLAAMLGAVPLMIGFGTGSELRQPLGIAVVGGLLFSQMLTLFTTPVIYLYMDRLIERLRRREDGDVMQHEAL